MNMKNIFLPLLLTLISANVLAQDGKPTKAQTVDYIQSNYPSNIIYVAAKKTSNYRMSAFGEFSDLKIAFAGTRLTAGYRDKVTTNFISPEITNLDQLDHDHTRVISFDMKDIESIEVGWNWIVGNVQYEEANDSRNFPMYLAFNAVGKKPLLTLIKDGGAPESVAQVMIPFTTAENRDAAIGEIKGSQMYKAFEHLRKLSGAPDPIRF
jgi:hypothetical protein